MITDGEGIEDTLRELFQECRDANGGRSLPVRVGIYPDWIDDVSPNVACDRAKYACDRHGGAYVSGFCTFDAGMLRQIEYARYVISHLEQALDEGWIHIHYQPIIRIATDRVCSEEALSRWVDPVRGMLSPKDYVPILEKARLIDRLDLYVLDRVLQKMRHQEREGVPVVPQSVNLSRADFDSLDIVSEICRRVDAAGIPRSWLIIEITESMVGSDFEFMKHQIERFRALGFQVWMDDFGSGYSSLDVLQDIRFDLIKFDMRFIHRFEDSPECRIILTELVHMAASLGVEAVCEGVETREQAEFLRSIGCEKLQGFFFSKPLPFEEIAARKRQGVHMEFEPPEGAGAKP